jgi:hypothetical protein
VKSLRPVLSVTFDTLLTSWFLNLIMLFKLQCPLRKMMLSGGGFEGRQAWPGIHGRARVLQPAITTMHYELATKGSRIYSPESLEIFLISTASRTTLGSIQWIPWARSSGIKQPRFVADHSPTSGAGVKNAWCICVFSPLYVFMVWCLSSGKTLPLPFIC